MEQLARFTDTLATNDALVRTFIKDLAGLSSQLAGERFEIQRAVASVARAVGTVRVFVGKNRSALVRVPLYHPGKEESTRMELRCPDPACNPYLTFAALLQAGLEGVEHGYELPEPMEKNLYHLAPDERRRLGIEQLPETLGEAIELTSESELMLRTLGEHMFNRYVEIKRQEWEEYRVQVTRWELDRYLSVL